MSGAGEGVAERSAGRMAGRAVAAARTRLLAAVRVAAPDARIEPTDEGVRVEGPGVASRLRWPAGLAR